MTPRHLPDNTNYLLAQEIHFLTRCLRVRLQSRSTQVPLLSIDAAIDRLEQTGPFAFFCDRGAESTSKELAGQYFRCDSLVEGVALLASAYWRATITAVRAACTTAVLTDPSSIPANPPRPWLPTTTSWADSEWSRRWRAGRSHTTTRRTVTSG